MARIQNLKEWLHRVSNEYCSISYSSRLPSSSSDFGAPVMPALFELNSLGSLGILDPDVLLFAEEMGGKLG